MIKHKTISVFEHQRLFVGEQNFKQIHLDALLKLNEYHNGNYFEPIAKGVKFNQYVGVIQVDGLTIEIHPKADKEDDDRKWKGVLIKMLKACGKLKAETNGAAHVRRQHLNLLEVYFELFLLEVEGLVRKGLIKKYRRQTHNTKALKGKLEFAGHLRHNVIHKERFYTTHQVYDSNHFLHQVLQKALSIVSQFTKGTSLQDVASRVELNFPEVDYETITAQQLNTIKLNRKTSSYKEALELARLIILNYSPDISSGKEKMLSLLFDMNELWEEYVLKQVQKASYKTDMLVSGQESRSFWGNNSLRPDIVLRKGNKTYVIDTKWKRPQRNSASVDDLRQMYAYCRFWNAEKAMLLYPGDFKTNRFQVFETDDYSVGQAGILKIDHQCKMGFVSVLNEENNDLDSEIGEIILKLLIAS
ncbi:5-methylcytosine restriction system specificity protein McrC [Oceanihabitans sediminis]|uniref:McrC family protein n=1 Tax=Oceanihabitans sediminis TaxID=1812012 RepID=UPI00299F4E90|nr:restriction endonuclease [Oceanihabitans sediminis]MDX1279192.1 restriction endonuclease [Oceanihabitans sediminis]